MRLGNKQFLVKRKGKMLIHLHIRQVLNGFTELLAYPEGVFYT
ncbi:hypothetical protein [Planktothrix mougeotii]|nr:hypothetical protein [Planktothrix mougeotii]